jgi:sulfate permease, SulP family
MRQAGSLHHNFSRADRNTAAHGRVANIMSEAAAKPGRSASGIAAFLPAFTWLRGYQPAWLRADIVAGITLAAYLLPSGLGDASLAGLPLKAGIYACLFPCLVFWLFCSSRHTAITVTSAISLLLGSSLATHDETTRYQLAICTALLVAGIALVAWLVKAGAIVNFISETVMIGFKTGVALYLTSTQLPKLFGFTGGHGDFWEMCHHFLTHLGKTNWVALAIGTGALTLLVAGKIFLKNRPVALFVIIGSIALASVVNLRARGVEPLGNVPSGLPDFRLPAVQWSDLNGLLPLATACFLLGAVETAAIGRMFARKHGNRFDSNQELLALAGANLAAGLGQGFPVSGGMSQSLVNESGGARTPLSGLVAGIIVLMVAKYLSYLLADMPKPVLAAVVLVAVSGLFKFSAIKHLWRVDRSEFVVAVAALLGVLGSGLLRGVLIGALISLVQLLRRASRPHVAFLGRIPNTWRFSDLARHADNEAIPGVLIFRVEASLLYFNADHVRDSVLDRVAAAESPVRLVIGDLGSSPHVDIAGAEMLMAMRAALTSQGVRFQIVEARASVRDVLRREGLSEAEACVDRFTSVGDAVERFVARIASPEPLPAPATQPPDHRE